MTLQSCTRQYQQIYLKKPLNLQEASEIEDKKIDIINHARKFLLFHGGNSWVTKERKPLFHAIIGNYNGEEVCELVRLYF